VALGRQWSLNQEEGLCFYGCEFCDVVSIFGHKMRYKPLQNIMKEIQSLEKICSRSIFIVDDNLIGDKNFVKELLKTLIEFNKTLDQPLRFCTQVTLNVAKDEELLNLFKQANFYMFFIGVETPVKESLIETNKRHNLIMDMKEAIRRIQSRGIYIVSGMVVGFDADDLNIFAVQSKFLSDSGLTVPMISVLYPIKGTKLWDRLKTENRLFKDKRRNFISKSDSEFSYNFIPKNMTPEELQGNYLIMLQEVFSYSHFLKQFQALIDQIDLDQVRKDSPLTWRMRSRRRKLSFLLALLLFKNFVINGSKESRLFFYSVIKIALKKSWICLGLALDILFYFVSNYSLSKNLA